MNPRSGRERRAIEVYPHPATVVLFGLDRILRYKQKRGRDVDLLRSELLTLMTHVETLVTTDDAWAQLRASAESATRKSELRCRRGPGRRGDLRLRRAVRRAVAGAHRHLRRRRDRLHRHPGAARGAARGGRRTRRHPGVRRARTRARARCTAVRRAGHQRPGRGRHQLPQRHRPHQGRRVVRRQGGPDGRRPPGVHRPAARDHRPDRRPGDHLRAQRRLRGGRPAR